MNIIVAERKENIQRLTAEKEKRAKALSHQQMEERTRVLNLLSLLEPSDFEAFKENIIETYFKDEAVFDGNAAAASASAAGEGQIVEELLPNKRKNCKCGRNLERL